MLRKLFLIGIIIITIILIGSSAVFAMTLEATHNKYLCNTDQFLVNISRPDGDESTYKNTYVICGYSNYDDVRIQLMLYNKKTGRYELFRDTYGNCRWEIGSSGFFIKEIEIPKYGQNLIRLVAYKKYEGNKLVLGKNLQVNDFSVTLLDRSLKSYFRSRFFTITDFLNRLFDGW